MIAFDTDILTEVLVGVPEFDVLPVVLEISDAALYGDTAALPRRDAVWPILFKRDHPSMEDACLHAVVTALGKLAEEKPESVMGHIEVLKPRTSFIANYLLLSLYTAAASFADEAVDLLCQQPWRLHCGYSDSPYWMAMGLICEAAPACSPENLARLETILLAYSSDYEKTAEGRRFAGHSRFTLLSAVPEHLRSKKAQSHLGIGQQQVPEFMCIRERRGSSTWAGNRQRRFSYFA